MTVEDIISSVERTAPIGLAYSWDNSGFLCGRRNKKVKRVYCTLDTNVYTVREAVRAKADMILSHHPIMFNGINRIDYDEPQGQVIKTLIENDVALYAAHTSMDTARGGLNDLLAEKLGLRDTTVIDKNNEFVGCGLGRIGKADEMSLDKFAGIVCDRLETPFVRVGGDGGKIIRTVAVGSGACDDLIPAAIEMKADVLVTADMKYHITMDAVERGLAIIDAGHFPTENFVTDIFAKCLEGLGVDIVISSEKDVFGCYIKSLNGIV